MVDEANALQMIVEGTLNRTASATRVIEQTEAIFAKHNLMDVPHAKKAQTACFIAFAEALGPLLDEIVSEGRTERTN